MTDHMQTTNCNKRAEERVVKDDPFILYEVNYEKMPLRDKFLIFLMGAASCAFLVFIMYLVSK